MKVFLLTEFSCVDFDTTINTKVFEKKDDAIGEMISRAEAAIDQAKNIIPQDEFVCDITEDSYDIYREGRASEWEVMVRVEEKEICEGKASPNPSPKKISPLNSLSCVNIRTENGIVKSIKTILQEKGLQKLNISPTEMIYVHEMRNWYEDHKCTITRIELTKEHLLLNGQNGEVFVTQDLSCELRSGFWETTEWSTPTLQKLKIAVENEVKKLDFISTAKNLFTALKTFVKENQGEDKYIFTETDDDKIYVYPFGFQSSLLGEPMEMQLKGLRVKDDELEIAFDSPEVTYDEDDLVNANWVPFALDGDTFVNFSTLYSIAEGIL